MNNFIYYIPTKIYFGKGRIASLADELRNRAKKILIVTGQGSVKRNGIFDDAVKEVKKKSILFWRSEEEALSTLQRR